MRSTIIPAAVALAATAWLHGEVLNEVRINTPNVTMNAKDAPVGGEKAFADGQLYYNAIPSTPAIGQSVKVIDSKDDTDFIIKIYELKNTGIVYEIRDFLIATVEKENGKVTTSVDTQTGKEYVHITAPQFQYPWIESAIHTLDKPGTSYEKSGSARIYYVCQNRRATELEDVIRKTLGTSYGDLVFDDRINVIMVKDAPSVRDRVAKWLPYFDIAPQMVRIDAEIIEIEGDDDFNFGMALEAWKEALPERVDTVLNFNQAKEKLQPGPDKWVQGAVESINIQGMRPKAAANLINYLVRTGKARVLSRPSVVAINGQEANISSLDVISYRAYSKPESPLNKQASTGVSLTITPTITEQSITLKMDAQVNSLVSWASGNEPIINTRTTTADAVLKDGEMFTLSGLRKDTIAKEDERVPILGGIPLVGYAFRHEIDVKKSSEIVVLLTPRKVTASNGVLDRERELVSTTQEQLDAQKRGTVDAFVDRVILNKKP